MSRAPSIAQYWNAADVPVYIEPLIATFRDCNPDFDHHLFNELEANRFILERFGSREAAAFRACAVPSMQSDYLRYCSVLADGGVYADADFRCLRSLLPLVEDPAAGEIFLGPTEYFHNGLDARRVWSGFFAFGAAGHPFLRLALDIATANIEARIPERIWPIGKKVVEGIWLTVGPGVPSMMRFMRELGSFDAFIEAIAGTDAEPFGDLYCEVVGDYGRIVEAFERVRVSPYEALISWVARPDSPPPYKETDVHWKNVKSRIFR